MKKLLAALLCLTTIGLTACKGADQKAKGEDMKGEKMQISASSVMETPKELEGRIRVTASFDAMKEFVFAVGGDKVAVSTVIPTGVEPHDFEPKAKDLAGIGRAQIFVYNGLGMEPWAEEAIKAAGNDKLISVKASEGIEMIHSKEDMDEDEHEEDVHEDADSHEEEEHGHEHGEYDPHVWLSTTGAKTAADHILKALVSADPENKSYYEENYKVFAEKLDALHAEYTEKFNSVSNKHFVTGHAAFAYLCKEFSLEQNSVENTFAEGEPTAQELAKLVEYCKANNVKTIFAEEMASPQVSETLASEVGAKVETIYTMESAEDDQSYLERMESNLSKIYESMKG